MSPLSLKKLNLSDFEEGGGGEHKRRRSYDAKDGTRFYKVGSSDPAPSSSSPHVSPPASPHVHVAREIKHEGGNVVRLQVSRNYASAANAVDEHFTRSLSGELNPSSPIPVTRTSTPPPLEQHNHQNLLQHQHHQQPTHRHHHDKKHMSLKSLLSTEQEPVSPNPGDAGLGHDTAQDNGAAS